MTEQKKPGKVALPKPELKGSISLEEALARRRSVREFLAKPLTLAEAGQLLWSAQGITESGRGLRTAPSAGATYPLNMLFVAGNVTGLASAVYRYDPASHSLTLAKSGDLRQELAQAALDQGQVAQAPASLVITGIYSRTTARYGDRGQN